jgi:accessory gene regulator protein AgrB
MPLLKICRLPFNHNNFNANHTENYLLKYPMTLPKLLNINHLRRLTIGIHTSHFLECLLLCIPFIENLSFGIEDRDINENDDAHDKIT